MSASVVTSSEAAAAVATVDDVVAGTLLGVSEGVATVRLFATGQEVQVILAQGADVQPGRPATSPDFSAFVVGESVALRFVPSASAGPAIATLFQSVVKSGIVEMTSASEQALATSEGRFRAGYARLSSWRGRRARSASLTGRTRRQGSGTPTPSSSANGSRTGVRTRSLGGLAFVCGKHEACQPRGLGPKSDVSGVPNRTCRPPVVGSSSNRVGCCHRGLVVPGSLGGVARSGRLVRTFAAAGARSLANGATVPCNCFGGYGRERRLGWPQVIQFVPVAGLVFWAAASWQGSPWTVAQGAALVGGCTAIGASIHLVLARPSWTRVRADRLSRQETSIVRNVLRRSSRPMAEILIVVFGVSACALVLLACAGLVEVFRQLEEIRGQLKIDDQPLVLDYEPADVPGELVPADVLRGRTALVFLHARCGTCRLIAEEFRSRPTPGVWFVVPEGDAEATKAFKELVASGKVVLDVGEQLAEALRMDVSPAFVVIDDGKATSAAGVSTLGQMRQTHGRDTPTFTAAGRGLARCGPRSARSPSRRPRASVSSPPPEASRLSVSCTCHRTRPCGALPSRLAFGTTSRSLWPSCSQRLSPRPCGQ